MGKSKRRQGLRQIAESYKGQLDSATDIGQGIGHVAKAASDLANLKPISAISNVMQAVGKGVKGTINSFKNAGKMFVGVFKTLFNHPEWYLNYDGSRLVNLNYGINKGVPSDAFRSNKSVSPVNAVRINTYLTIPVTADSAWKQGLNILFNTIRSANSGAINYSVFDLEKYIFNVRALHVMYCSLRRAYATLRNVSLYDSTTPKSLFTALGLDFDSFAENAANLKMLGNRFSLMLSNLYPIKMNLIDRTDWMFSNFFADSNDAKFTPYCFTIQQPKTTGESGLQMIMPDGTIKTYGITAAPSATTTGLDYNTVAATALQMLEDMGSYNVFNVIAGDMLKAFGTDAIYPTEVWGDEMAVPVVYDEAALTQIQNLTVTGVDHLHLSSSASTFTICAPKCDRNLIATADAPLQATLHNRLDQLQIVNTYKDNMGPGDTLSATRLKAVVETSAVRFDDSTYNVLSTVNSCGTELVSELYFIYLDTASANLYQMSTYRVSNAVNGNASDTTAHVWAQVDYCPLTIIGERSTSTTAILFDFNNYAFAGTHNIDNFHGMAALSLLAVPRLARVSNTTLINK